MPKTKKEEQKETKLRKELKVLSAARSFKTQFKTTLVTAITAAFALVIALSWNDAIKESVTAFIINLGISSANIYLYKIYTALIVTFIAVIAIILFSKWGAKQNSNK